jgi:hypothetical protein
MKMKVKWRQNSVSTTWNTEQQGGKRRKEEQGGRRRGERIKGIVGASESHHFGRQEEI